MTDNERVCILTGAPGENPDDCTTHDHESEKMSQLIMLDGKPVSSCCQAEVERTCDYTDTHVFDVTEAYTDESGKVVSATYTFRKTYDGTDGENVTFTCQDCGQEIEQDDIEWDEA